MKVSAAGLSLIKQFEGLSLTAYRDTGGVPTIGYGHTHGVRMGQTITQEQADVFLIADVSATACAITSMVLVSVTQYQFDALVSFAYNVGVANLRSSALLKLLNASQYGNAADEFLRWNRASGRILAGLTNRRAKERAFFLGALA